MPENQRLPTCRVYFSVYPLGSSEPSRVLLAVREVWANPSWQRCAQHHGAWLVEGGAEAVVPDATLEAFSERLSVAIWRRLGRYVKVVVDLGRDDADEGQRRELGQPDYLKLMRIH